MALSTYGQQLTRIPSMVPIIAPDDQRKAYLSLMGMSDRIALQSTPPLTLKLISYQCVAVAFRLIAQVLGLGHHA
jgi:hypothetical protein